MKKSPHFAEIFHLCLLFLCFVFSRFTPNKLPIIVAIGMNISQSTLLAVPGTNKEIKKIKVRITTLSTKLAKTFFCLKRFDNINPLPMQAMYKHAFPAISDTFCGSFRLNKHREAISVTKNPLITNIKKENIMAFPYSKAVLLSLSSKE